jgi:hypothetical protein
MDANTEFMQMDIKAWLIAALIRDLLVGGEAPGFNVGAAISD